MVAPSIRANARELERNMKKDSLNRSLTDRPEEQTLVDSGKMLGRTIMLGELAIDQMSAKLQSTEKQLNMEMRKHTVEESLYQRPSPAELKELLPSVYDSLSEEAKEFSGVPKSTPLFKVYASLLLATAAQLLIVEKITSEQFDTLNKMIQDEKAAQHEVLFRAAEVYKRTGKYDEYEKSILACLYLCF